MLVRHQTKNPQHPYFETAKQRQQELRSLGSYASERPHFSHIPEGNFRERFNLALKEGRCYAV